MLACMHTYYYGIQTLRQAFPEAELNALIQWMLDGELYYVGYACKIITHTNHLAN